MYKLYYTKYKQQCHKKKKNEPLLRDIWFQYK